MKKSITRVIEAKMFENTVLFLLAASCCLLSSIVSVAGDSKPDLVKVAEGFNFPEGPAWDGKEHLYVSNCGDTNISRYTPDQGIDHTWMRASENPSIVTHHKSNGLTVFRDGRLYVCDHGRKAIVVISPDKKCQVLVQDFEGVGFKGPNDLAFDPEGNLYFTDPTGSGRKNPVGCIYKVAAKTARVSKVASGLAFPNGLAFSADAKVLFVCESQFNRILKFRVLNDGSLSEMAVFSDLSEAGDGEPDGMAVDLNGDLWIAHYGTHQALLVSGKSGKIIRRIAIPFTSNQGPTNVEFAGKDLRDLYITDPGSSALYKLRTETAGLKLFCSP